jgi:dihydropteroate synthase
MGVMNITPDSFSDGGEFFLSDFQAMLKQFGHLDALDIGAESTAPMNVAISHEQEWERLQPILSQVENLNCTLSLDTYHPETIFKLARNWKGPLIWNDVSGKFDESVREFLEMSEKFHYVFCHNLAASRELSIKHMDYLSNNEDEDFIEELAAFFNPHIHPRVIFDPCLGFSKSYEQNWYVLNHFSELQKRISHDRWLIGFSRKSFLRRKYNVTLKQRDRLDQLHIAEVARLIPSLIGEVWIRTHRPEML